VGLGMNVYGAVSSNQGYGGFNGTSMSCPLIAGICALVLEEFPDLTIYNMVKIIRKSGDTPIPNNDRGWGKVDAVKALTVASSAPAPPTAFSLTDAGRGYLTAHWTNPIANVDGTPLDDFDAINIYERGILLTSFTRSPGDTGRADSAVFIPWGTNLPYYVTAVNNESLPNESTPSNIVYSPLSAPSNFSVKLLGHDPLGKHTTFGIALPQPSPIT
ncbi:MAG: S8 family serine peptidase, partial [Aliifodinibius sp.]|nr:S8 family serine peptidase [Fodinibius sp.]NIV16789.1 S8 family serine peptidase [Fodinibius sp.]NIY30788.1 S8 family serine peptidase [Fodinibius sp.]